MNIRESYEKSEEMFLSDCAFLSRNTRGRETPEEPCELRTEFQRDRDRVIHCKSFRRLKHKTQVFLSPEGDHFRTRLTHTLEVSQIARTMARALRLNEDLTEAISLAHDLGHTPFGHAGERALNEIYGFRHYEQSVRVVEKLEKNGQGLNLTWEVRNGILCHTCGEEAATLEGRLVRIADKIAYINHDIDDAVRAGVLTDQDIPRDITDVLGDRRTARIDSLVKSVISNSAGGTDIRMDRETEKAYNALHDFMYEHVYLNPYVKGEEKKVPGLIEALFTYLKKTEKIPEDMKYIARREGIDRAVCDYIAGMTDHFAVALYKEIFIPKGWDL
jgi:dGTPase